MDEATVEKLKHLLSKDVIRDNLAKAGVYTVGYEFLKGSLIERPKTFFTCVGLVPDDDYKAEIRSKHKDPLIASCLWFKEQGVLSDEDIEDVRAFRNYRNEIAHELLNVLQKGAEIERGHFNRVSKSDES